MRLMVACVFLILFVSNLCTDWIIGSWSGKKTICSHNWQRTKRCTANLPFRMNLVGRVSSPLVLPEEKCKPWAKSAMFKFSCLSLSQGLEFPTYFQGNVYWYPALFSSPQLGIPSADICCQDSIQTQLREFIQLKSLPHNPQLFFLFFPPPGLLNRVSLRLDFLPQTSSV